MPTLKTLVWQASIVLFLLHISLVAAGAEVIVESRVKLEVEKMTVMLLCVDEGLLETVEMDFRRCAHAISILKDSCWSKLDKLIGNYEVTANDEGMQRIADIQEVFTPCVQAKLLMTSVDSRHNLEILKEFTEAED